MSFKTRRILSDGQPTEYTEVPEKFSRIIEKVIAAEKAYFEFNPQATEFVRSYVPGELWPYHLPKVEQIRVKLDPQSAAGITRQFVDITANTPVIDLRGNQK